MMKVGSTTAVVCPPTTPPSRDSPPPHLLLLPHTPSVLDCGGSDSVSCCVHEVGKKRKLGSGPSAAAATMTPKVAWRIHPLASSSSSPKQAAAAAAASPPQERESAAAAGSTTTFVQADTSSFRELVQKLTGATAAAASDSDLEKEKQKKKKLLPIALPSRESSEAHKIDNSFGGLVPKPVVDMSARRSSSSFKKLHERRRQSCNLRKLEIHRLGASFDHRGLLLPSAAAAATDSLLLPPVSNQKFSSSSSGSPAASTSPVTPLTMELFEKAYAPKTPTPYEGGGGSFTGLTSRSRNLEQEEKGKENNTIHSLLHPSPPPSDPIRPQPELLSLFPLTSSHATEM